METLRDLARKSGRTVICTIHQPSSEIYETFDKLYLMVDGRIIYHGPKNEAVEHFSEIGFTCPKFANPADYFMMRVMQFSGSQEDVERVDRLVEARKRKEISPPEHGAPPDASKMRAARVSAFVQLNVLLRRSFLNYIRLPLNARAKLFQSVFIACFVGILYVPLGNDQTAIRDRSSALFIAVLNVTMNAVSGVVLTFSSEKSIVLRETANKMYGPTVYFFSKLLAEFPFELLFPSLYAILSFFIVGFNRTARTFFFYLLTVLIANHVGRGMGSIVAAAAPNGDAAVSLFPIVIIPFVLFSGLFIAPENIPVYFRWIADISPFRYGYEAFLTNEFKGITFRCKEDQFLIVNNQKVCPMTKGEQFLALRGLEPSDFASRIGAMLAIWVATTAAAFLVLRFKSKNRA
jgi:ABC-type multidrug transport system permease subunit